MNYGLIIPGVILVVDGIGSIIKYWRQSIPEQLVRVIRIGIGLWIIYQGVI